MNDSSSPSGSNASAPVLKAQGSANKAARRAKQAAALKANMQRRKAAARALAQAAGTQGNRSDSER